mmetsp:Transcript_30946/g.89989  ORF Transcript_30946/g.89989 Transcript_30946/m.89989 type:complete len:210 (-) Transcript_30946:1726-2355(-)
MSTEGASDELHEVRHAPVRQRTIRALLRKTHQVHPCRGVVVHEAEYAMRVATAHRALLDLSQVEGVLLEKLGCQRFECTVDFLQALWRSHAGGVFEGLVCRVDHHLQNAQTAHSARLDATQLHYVSFVNEEWREEVVQLSPQRIVARLDVAVPDIVVVFAQHRPQGHLQLESKRTALLHDMNEQILRRHYRQNFQHTADDVFDCLGFVG